MLHEKTSMFAKGSQPSSSLNGLSISGLEDASLTVESITTIELVKVQKVFDAVAALPIDLSLPICDRLTDLPANKTADEITSLIANEFDLLFQVDKNHFALRVGEQLVTIDDQLFAFLSQKLE